jgi:hypothetical protein
MLSPAVREWLETFERMSRDEQREAIRAFLGRGGSCGETSSSSVGSTSTSGPDSSWSYRITEGVSWGYTGGPDGSEETRDIPQPE